MNRPKCKSDYIEYMRFIRKSKKKRRLYNQASKELSYAYSLLSPDLDADTKVLVTL